MSNKYTEAMLDGWTLYLWKPLSLSDLKAPLNSKVGIMEVLQKAPADAQGVYQGVLAGKKFIMGNTQKNDGYSMALLGAGQPKFYYNRQENGAYVYGGAGKPTASPGAAPVSAPILSPELQQRLTSLEERLTGALAASEQSAKEARNQLTLIESRITDSAAHIITSIRVRHSFQWPALSF